MVVVIYPLLRPKRWGGAQFPPWIVRASKIERKKYRDAVFNIFQHVLCPLLRGPSTFLINVFPFWNKWHTYDQYCFPNAPVKCVSLLYLWVPSCIFTTSASSSGECLNNVHRILPFLDESHDEIQNHMENVSIQTSSNRFAEGLEPACTWIIRFQLFPLSSTGQHPSYPSLLLLLEKGEIIFVASRRVRRPPGK